MVAISATDTPPVAKRRTWRWFLIRTVLMYVGIPYVALVAIMGFGQRQLLYQPTRTDNLQASAFSTQFLPITDLELVVGGGLKLHGWRFPGSSTADSDPRYLVIYFPGNGGCRADRVSDCRDFRQLGYDVILFDYRGYGDNPGSPTEVALAADATRIWKFATEDLQFPSHRIVIFGESLGGAVATRLTAECCDAGTPPAALILNSTFASLAETVTWRFPMFPFQNLLLDRYPSVERIPHVTCPLLQYHGTADSTIAFQHGRRLFDAAPAQSANGIEKQFVPVPGGEHNFISMNDMQTGVSQLLKRVRRGELSE